jgi:hypothetical protein
MSRIRSHNSAIDRQKRSSPASPHSAILAVPRRNDELAPMDWIETHPSGPRQRPPPQRSPIRPNRLGLRRCRLFAPQCRPRHQPSQHPPRVRSGRLPGPPRAPAKIPSDACSDGAINSPQTLDTRADPDLPHSSLRVRAHHHRSAISQQRAFPAARRQSLLGSTRGRDRLRSRSNRLPNKSGDRYRLGDIDR